MDDVSPQKDIIARFGTEISRLHQDRVASVRHTLDIIASPQSEHNYATAAYYNSMDRNQLVVAIAQNAIEGVLHDFFFLLQENEEFRLVLQAADGTHVNLAEAVDEIKAFPFDWIDRKSSAGLEIQRKVDFILNNLPCETDQERRARTIRERAQARPDDQS